MKLTTKLCLTALLFLSSAALFVKAAPPFARRDIPRHRGCASHISAERRIAAEKRFKASRVAPAEADAKAVLDLHFHIVFANKTREGGYIPDEVIEKQIEVLNGDYNSTGVSFALKNVTRIHNEDWFLRVAPDSEEELEMKDMFRIGEASSLNIWTVGFMEGEGQGLLGYATFPSDYTTAPQKDGVVLLHSTMPDNGIPPYNQGRTLTHEVGHWAGLYHTFEGGCTGSGDSVDDTPPEKEAAYGCPTKPRASCPGGKPDPVTNFMNYTDDKCMAGFTPGQATRVRAQLSTFRGVEFK